ncbi:hypothetical protein Gohar_001420, partial [Gossypium harknessii]|nr:hypothetical protein [Gossypium harknessii]
MWICICSDGAVKVNLGSASAGGILKDQNGEWIIGFNCRIGICFVFEAELWGILDGVTLAQGSLHDRILIQIDNMKVIRDIKESFLKDSNSALI